MLIGQLARETQLTVDTIRYYEKEGLLDAAHFSRTANNYRQYTPAAVDRLLLIKRAQMLGFTLGEIRMLIGAWEKDELTTAQKEQLFKEKTAQIDRHIAALEQMKVYLRMKLDDLCADEVMQQAGVA